MARWFRRSTDETVREAKVYFKAGEYIFKENEPGDDMFIIKDGIVDILKRLDGEQKQLVRLASGDFFGEMSVLEKLPRTGSARAVTDCNLLRVDGSSFDDMMANNPEIAIRILRKMSRRLRQMNIDLESPVTYDPEIASLSVSSAEKLVHNPSGTEFFLSAEEKTTIGHFDPLTGLKPDIDLSAIDPEHTVNHCHATIVRHGEKLLFYGEIGAANSFINDQQIKPGLAFEIKNGDEIRFGDVKTIFLIN